MLNTTVLVELLAALPAGARVTVLEGDKLLHGAIADRAGLGIEAWEVPVLLDQSPRGPWPFARHQVEPVQLPNVIELGTVLS